MRQFPHSQSHIRMENISEIYLQCMESFSFLEEDLEVHLELQYKHFLIHFIQAPLHLGRILMVLIFPPAFHSQECLAPVLLCQCLSPSLLSQGQENFGTCFSLVSPSLAKPQVLQSSSCQSWVMLVPKLPNRIEESR